MRIDDVKQVFRTYESIVNFRAKRFGVLDGDLGLFITRAKFEEVGGFDAMPIMDDIAFGKKLKKCSRVNVLADVISVSSRKWHDQGFVKTLMGYLLAYLQYWTRIPFYKDKYVQG